MNKLDFWSDWEASYRLLFQVLGVFLILMIASMLVVQLGDFSYFYDWDITAYLQEVHYPVFSQHSEFMESTVSTEISLLLQKVSGGYQLLSPWMMYLFTGILYLMIAGLLAVVSNLSRFWFVVCMGLWVLLVAGAGIDKLGFLGLQDEWAVGIVAAIFILPTYYFQSYREDFSLFRRWGVIVGLMIFVAILLHFTSVKSHPLLYLANYSYWPSLVLTIIFILYVGHEIVYAILILTTQGSGDKNNIRHFMILTAVYLLNVTLVYLKSIGYLDWEFYYVNAFLLVSISAVLGFWGLKGREILYGGSLPFYPYAAFFYLFLAVIGFSTLLLFSLSGNDSGIEVIRKAVVYGHLAFGGMFFLYVLINFITLLVKGLPVYKVVFKEDNFPYASSRLAGAVIVAAFFFVSDNAPLYQAVTGYFNGMGDMHLMMGDHVRGQKYYKIGSTYGNILNQSNGDHKSNYMLGAMEPDHEKAIPYMKNAVSRRPTEYAYAGLGSAYEQDNRFFDALFTYQEGLSQFPNSWALQNNLALLYNRTSVIDSVMYYLNSEGIGTWYDQMIASNLVAISTIRNLPLEGQVDINELKEGDRLGLKTNLMGYQIAQGQVESPASVLSLESPGLHLYTYSYFKNLGLANMLTGSEQYLALCDALINEPRNGEYRNDLILIKALNQYRVGQVAQAFELLNSLKEEIHEYDGSIDALLGKWSMELGYPYQASKYFELAREAGFDWVSADLAQAYALIGEESMAQFILRKEISELDSSRLNVAEPLEKLISRLEAGTVKWENSYSYQSETALLEKLDGLEKDTTQATAIQFEQLALNNPFFENGVVAAAGYFNKALEDKDRAYGVLVNAIGINEYSVTLIKAYIEQCLKMGLFGYAEDTILRLYDILPLPEFQAYELEYEQMKSQAQANLDSW